ncbi:MAG: hypothetical protein C7B45_17120 [Sulfobacillus acidophilus]|uniref:Uncharacterized protein n=1 Tax=Sulfobacillus acidophilus TaxID=53633 RepID=A0A2T2WCN5_9FIRM|nr:MAG: hypothetical protein C7B45_17120 [Sulfobacillus acidophilus]
MYFDECSSARFGGVKVDIALAVTAFGDRTDHHRLINSLTVPVHHAHQIPRQLGRTGLDANT